MINQKALKQIILFLVALFLMANISFSATSVSPQPEVTFNGEIKGNRPAERGVISFKISKQGTSIFKIKLTLHSLQSNKCSDGDSVTIGELSLTPKDLFPIEKDTIEFSIDQHKLKGQFISPTEANGIINLVFTFFEKKTCNFGTWTWSAKAQKQVGK